MHSAQEFIHRAAVVTALIDQIESSGYACEVIGFASTTDGDDLHTQVSVQLKNSNQPVDLARLAFGLGHPAMFRRLIFAQWGIDDFNKDLGQCLGFSGCVTDGGLADKGIYIIPSINGTGVFETEEKAQKEGLEYIIKSLKEQGCPAI